MTNTDVQEGSDWTPMNLMDCIARDTHCHWTGTLSDKGVLGVVVSLSRKYI